MPVIQLSNEDRLQEIGLLLALGAKRIIRKKARLSSKNMTCCKNGFVADCESGEKFAATACTAEDPAKTCPEQ